MHQLTHIDESCCTVQPSCFDEAALYSRAVLLKLHCTAVDTIHAEKKVTDQNWLVTYSSVNVDLLIIRHANHQQKLLSDQTQHQTQLHACLTVQHRTEQSSLRLPDRRSDQNRQG